MKAMNMMAARKEKGFTLIELVMVIVILGILAAFALPRFADLGGDAARASVEGARGAVKSASGIVRSKALAEGKGSDTSVDGTAGDGVTLEGVEIELVGGYLATISVEDAAQLADYTVLPDPAASPLQITIDDPQTDSPCFTFTESNGTIPAAVSAIGTWNDSGTTPVCDV